MMIPRTMPLPAVHTEIFTTVTDNQTELEITVLQVCDLHRQGGQI